MDGNHAPVLRGGWFAVALAVSVCTFVSEARAQAPLPLTKTPVDGVGQFAPEDPQAVPPSPRAVPGPADYPNAGAWPRAETSRLDTIRESLFGDASAEGKWRPLTLGSFFSEGWNEPWAGGPAGQSGLTPRHGWLGAFEGVFYRLWLVNGTYQNNVNQPQGGNAYGGSFAAFLPFNRRFEIKFDAPFVAANGTVDPTRGYRSDFGDLSVAASFLLSETKAFTQLATLGVVLPTGKTETGGGLLSLFPRYSFWSNPCGAWVVRGGTGVSVPLNNSSAQTTYNADVAVGRYFRPHDVLFGDLVFYLNANVLVPLEGGPTTLGVGPGTRFQIAKNWYFLNYWEAQVAGYKPYSFQTQVAIVKAW